MPNEKKARKGDGRPWSREGQPSEPPIDHREAGLDGWLEPNFVMPNGGTTPRCQARKRGGGQCAAPARKGFKVCVRHGAGLPSREATGERKRVSDGSRMTHGLYSRRGRRKIAEIVAELEAAQVELDDSDGEMRVMRATLSFLLGQADIHEGAADKIGGVYAVLERTLSHQTLEPVEARAIGNAMTAADRLLGRTESWVRAVLDAARFLVKASLERSHTRARVAEARALEVLTKYIHVLRGILFDVLETEQLDVIEGRLMRDIFIPNGLEMPDRDEPLLA